MTKDQPDKRLRPEPPKDPFGDFQYRQALAEDSHLREEPQLILIIQGKINSEIISKIKALKSVKGIVLKK